jgi:hypothetical protein
MENHLKLRREANRCDHPLERRQFIGKVAVREDTPEVENKEQQGLISSARGCSSPAKFNCTSQTVDLHREVEGR